MLKRADLVSSIETGFPSKLVSSSFKLGKVTLQGNTGPRGVVEE